MFNNTDSRASSNTPLKRLAHTSSQFPQLSHSHRAQDVRRAEFIPGPTGPFRSLIEEYLITFVPSSYKPSTVLQVGAVSLSSFGSLPGTSISRTSIRFARGDHPVHCARARTRS
jgi:hypothetical protein